MLPIWMLTITVACTPPGPETPFKYRLYADSEAACKGLASEQADHIASCECYVVEHACSEATESE
jgi:hypothetical protein